MFSTMELQILSSALDAELDFLRSAERHGVPSVRQVAAVAAIKAKIADLVEAAEKAPKEEAPR